MPLLDAKRQLGEGETAGQGGAGWAAGPGAPGRARWGVEGPSLRVAGNFPNTRSQEASASSAPGTLATAHKKPYLTIFEGKKAQCPSSPCG